MTKASELLTAYGFDLLKILVLFCMLYVVAWKMLPNNFRPVGKKRFSLMTLGVLLALYGFAENQEPDTDPYRLMIFALGKDISSPMAVFSQGYVAHHLASTSKEAREHRQSDRLQAKKRALNVKSMPTQRKLLEAWRGCIELMRQNPRRCLR